MKNYLILLTTALVSFSCQNNNANSSEKIGNEKDAHGCLLSAGYRWSIIQEKCVRPWEEGIEMLISKASADYESAAFSIIDPSTHKAEIFLGEAENLILEKVAPFLYSNAEYQLIEENNCWSLIHMGEKIFQEKE